MEEIPKVFSRGSPIIQQGLEDLGACLRTSSSQKTNYCAFDKHKGSVLMLLEGVPSAQISRKRRQEMPMGQKRVP